ncbi:LIM and calponin homology domains-containing protein 1-like isoform X3 [Myripristis murdjan]|uniref:LIM and calponin homology domains-containing protein 1-like isoform X3 n=1 Tax=Myripristis murdjan TaxID=586833 RepID=UPI00117629DC|nr:LIM and calponin homology domains-containing protein 1-like isoform X3 [Myripristis murdjan]
MSEAVTGRSFGDKDFRSGLENGILLCELLSAIKPGLVKKINRLPTPIAGLDNLTVFLRGCEELGLRGSQLFDPGDLQDTSIRANLKDSDCNRKLKNVLNTVFWLGKAASGCTSYSGPTLNLKEFEGLLAQMRMESEEGGDSTQQQSVRDSGYDCWDSERSESLSPPRHTRDNSLDSLDSFGSRSQHSPSPDVVNRSNVDGRGSDSEADGPNRKPDVRKDDMLARRTASTESRSSIPFNQFLPNRTNASSYIPTPRRKPRAEDGEQRRMSRRVAFLSEDTESVSMGDMHNEEEVGHMPPLSQSRFERMHEHYNNCQDEDQWQDDLARWKSRRRCASHELIKKEEERKRMEKRLKEEGSDTNKRKSIKTYKEIVEEKERREAELCEAYRKAETPEEAAMVLQRYALRFTISDATLDSLKLPRSTPKPKVEQTQVLQEHKPTQSTVDSETSDLLHKPEPTITMDQQHKPEEIGGNAQERSASFSSSTPALNNPPDTTITHSQHTPPQYQEPNEPQTQHKESPTTNQPPLSKDTPPQAKEAPPQTAQTPPHSVEPVHTQPCTTAPSRPVPLLTAKPYCQPRNTHSGHKSVKLDGLVRVNGEVTEETPVSPCPSSPLRLPEGDIDAPSELLTTTSQTTAEQSPRPHTEKGTASSGSAISSLIGGRNCIITTTIVTELTQTHVEPLPLEIHSNGQVNGTLGLLRSPAEETEAVTVTSPNNILAYSPTVTEGLEESNVTEQYQREQEKLKEEWERAQIEVEEEERRHNEEERRILEETATPLNPSGLSNQKGMMSPPEQNHKAEKGNVSTQQNGQKVSTGSEDQHASKLHFFQDSSCDGEPSKKQELWKTASLDRNSPLTQSSSVKRSGSHDTVIGSEQSSSSSPQPSSPSRCVSGKRLCSGCSQPLGKGAAMIIDTLGLFFHLQCFKCGVCDGQLGDTTAGTDVRIRNGLLSCNECYIASRGGGQPTTL